jgi:hypothetical protein
MAQAVLELVMLAEAMQVTDVTQLPNEQHPQQLKL